MLRPKQESGAYVSFFSFLNFTHKVATTDPRLARQICAYYSGNIKMKACRSIGRADMNITLSRVQRLPAVPSSFRKVGQASAASTCLQYYKDGGRQIYILKGHAYMVARVKNGEFDIYLKKMEYSGSFIKTALILFYRSKGRCAGQKAPWTCRTGSKRS